MQIGNTSIRPSVAAKRTKRADCLHTGKKWRWSTKHIPCQWSVHREISHPSSMSKSEPSVQRSRFFHPIVNGLFWMVLLGFWWMQLGVWGICLGVVFIVLGAAASRIRRATAPSPSEDNKAGRTRHERVLSPVPAEAAKARVRLILQFVGGILYLAFASLLLTGLTRAPFLIVFGAVTSGVTFTGAMILVWATSGALQTQSRRNQFSISTLLLLTTILAVYLGAIRLLVDLSGERLGAGGNTFLAAAVICLIMTGVSLPFLASLVWLAAWFVRCPQVQRRLRK